MSDPIDSDSPPCEKYFTYAEAAEILRVKHRTVSRLMWAEQNKRWRHTRDKTRLIPQSLVERWLKERMILVRNRASRQDELMA